MAKVVEQARGGRRTRRSAAEWQAEVAGWRASGLTAKQYAQTQGVHAGTLMGWASRLAKGAKRRPRAGQETAARARFIPVRVTPPLLASRVDGQPGLTAEIILISGRRVRLSGELKLEQLGQLLDALEGGRAC